MEEITEKHIESLIGRKVILLINLCGSVKGCFIGKVNARLRNRFKHYMFESETPYVSFFFTPSDVREIEENEGTFYIKLGEADEMDSENKKNRKQKTNSKKSAQSKFVAEPIIDLNADTETITLSAQATSEIRLTRC